MPRGGYRVGSGRPRGSRNRFRKIHGVVVDVFDIKPGTPLAHMLDVMNDPEQDVRRRDNAAIAAAPYCHPKATKEQGDYGDDTDE